MTQIPIGIPKNRQKETNKQTNKMRIYLNVKFYESQTTYC